MHIDTEHWLTEARKSFCTNYNDRPGGIEDISLILIHCISLPAGEYSGDCIDRLFANQLDTETYPELVELKELQVSSHLLIRRDGELVQYVAFDKRAWHAGTSEHRGRQNCNDFSIGIELEGVDDGLFEQIQYDQLCRVCQTLIERYPALQRHSFAGHSEVARPRGRKTDPGSGFDWQRFLSMLR